VQQKQPTVEQAFALATEHLKAGRLPEAEKGYRAILQAQPAHALSLHNLGLIAHRVGRNDAAVGLFAKAIAVNPAMSAFHVNLGQALRALGKNDEAIESYKRAIAVNPNDAFAHSNLGHLLLAERRTGEAEPALLRGVQLKPDDFDARLAYAQLLLAGGRRDEALAQLETAGKYANRANFNSATLGKIYARAGEAAKAKAILEAALKKDPADAEGCAMVLAALGSAQTPDRASDAYLKKLYAERAVQWDSNVERHHNYRGMALVEAELRRLAAGSLRILDAGCGTGLVGKRIRDLATELHGVDLSQPMLLQAQAAGSYDRLFEGDMLEFMRMNPASYDAIASAATLIHFGELGGAFQAAALALKPGGVFVFTLFPNPDPAAFAVGSLHGFAEGGCYFHGKDYVAQRAAQAGFDVLRTAEEIHEFTDGKPVTGLVVTLRRSA
jgi:predicted TPR repeat methyltransferase